jgi:hypothetical protein
MNTAQADAIAISAPRIQVWARAPAVCGQANAEMISQMPIRKLTQRGYASWVARLVQFCQLRSWSTIIGSFVLCSSQGRREWLALHRAPTASQVS